MQGLAHKRRTARRRRSPVTEDAGHSRPGEKGWGRDEGSPREHMRHEGGYGCGSEAKRLGSEPQAKQENRETYSPRNPLPGGWEEEEDTAHRRQGISGQ
jgi:hypothetical protein